MTPDEILRRPVEEIERALLFFGQEPELVIVDRRILKLLIGDLQALIVLDTFEGACSRMFGPNGPELEPGDYVWDRDPLCGE